MAKRIEEVRKYFVNPEDPGSVEKLAGLGADTIRVMADIYASGGDVEKMNSNSVEWMERNGGDEVSQVIGELLSREAETRRFDNKFMGQIHPQGNMVGILGNLVAAYMNTNTIVKEVSMSEHKMEGEVVGWLGDMFGYKKNEFSGNVVTDGTLASLTALWVARAKKVKEITDRGDDPNKTIMHVLVNDMKHYSIDKSCEILGTNIKVDVLSRNGYKTDLNSCAEIIREVWEKGEEVMAIVGLAGETETAEVDNLFGLAQISRANGIYLHVDAAYGGPFVLSSRNSLFRGIELADSITVDPHKMLYVPYQAGVVLFRDKKDHALIQKNARYLQPEENEGLLGDPDKRNYGFAARVEGSMGAGGVLSTWATLRLLGSEGVTALLEHDLELTRYCFERVSASEILRPIHVPELNTLLIGLRSNFGLDGMNYKKLMEKVQTSVDKKYGYYISVNGEVDNGWSAFRFVAMHPWTTEQDVETLITLLEKEVVASIY